MSQPFSIAASSRTPSVTINPETQSALIEGECYPEDTDKFFTALNQGLDDYFSAGNKGLDLKVKLIYFNSSSARALMELMDSLESKASNGVEVNVQWFYEDGDDITQEFIEDVISDYQHLKLSVSPSLDS
jgi:hypothetical protein